MKYHDDLEWLTRSTGVRDNLAVALRARDVDKHRYTTENNEYICTTTLHVFTVVNKSTTKIRSCLECAMAPVASGKYSEVKTKYQQPKRQALAQPPPLLH